MNAITELGTVSAAASWLGAWTGGDARWWWTSLGDHLLQSTAFAAFVLVAAALCRRAAARTRYALWLLAAVKFALPTFAIGAWVSPHFAWLESAPAVASTALTSGTSVVVNALTPLSIAAATRPPFVGAASWIALGAVWLAGILGFAIVLARRGLAFHRSIRRRRAIRSGAAFEALARATRRHGLRRAVTLVEIDACREPAVIGVVRPMIALPEGIVERLGNHDLEMIFLHELAHVRRRDNLVAGLTTALCVALWFWPVVWWIQGRLLAERERACDEEAVIRCGRPDAYLASLLEVCRWSVGRPWLGASTLGGSNLGRRAESIAELAGMPRGAIARNGVVALAAAVLLAISLVDVADSARRTPVASAVTTPSPDAPRASRSRADDGAIEAAFEHAVRTEARFVNGSSSPVEIRSATVEIGSIEGETLVGPPALELVNRTGRAIASVRVRLRLSSVAEDAVDVDLSLAPHASGRVQPDRRTWWNRVPPTAGFAPEVVVDAVRFSDGGSWNASATPAPDLAASPPAVTMIPARVDETPGMPLRFVSAGMPSGPDREGPFAEISNESSLRIVAVKLRFKAAAPSHAVMVRNVDLPPHGRVVLRAGVPLQGDPAALRVQLIGVQFENGSVWGQLDGTIDARQEHIDVPATLHRP